VLHLCIKFKVRRLSRCAFTLSALIGLVTLTFNFLTLKLVRFIAHGVGNLLTNFGVNGTFHSRLMGQQLSDGHVTLRP